jgi:hypothetical protein
MFKRRYWARQITWLLVVIRRMPIKLDEVDIGFRFANRRKSAVRTEGLEPNGLETQRLVEVEVAVPSSNATTALALN